MEQIHRSTLTKARERLVSDLIIDPILDELIVEDILSDEDFENITSESTRLKKIRSLLKTLPFRGSMAFKCFVNALTNTNQTHLAKELNRIEAEIRSDQGLPITSQSACEEIDEQSLMFGQSETMSVCVNPEVPDGSVHAQKHDYGESYPIDPKNPGYVLIINNSKFDEDQQTFRLGSNCDIKNLDSLFRDLNYQVEAEENLSSESMLTRIKSFANDPKLSKGSVCAVVLMSHGLKGEIYGTDNNLIKLSDIYELFSSDKCPQLDGKPKLFIIQACRGHKKDKGYSEVDGASNCDSMTDAFHSNLMGDSLETVESVIGKPKIIDCVFAYSTFEDYVSFRTEERGSWFISVLCDVFRENIIENNKSMSVLTLLTRVNKKVVQDYGNSSSFTQMPKPEHTLLKSFFLKM